MTDKITVERDFKVIEEFVRLSMLCGKEERMMKVVQNFIVGKIPEMNSKDGIYILYEVLKAQSELRIELLTSDQIIN